MGLDLVFIRPDWGERTNGRGDFLPGDAAVAVLQPQFPPEFLLSRSMVKQAHGFWVETTLYVLGLQRGPEVAPSYEEALVD